MEADDWQHAAFTDSALVAAALLRLHAGPASSPASHLAPPPAAWGRRERRCRTGRGGKRRIGDAARSRRVIGNGSGTGRIWDDNVDTASQIICNGKDVEYRRPSPMTPLEYRGGGSGLSESGSEEMTDAMKRSGTGEFAAFGGGGGEGGGERKVVTDGEVDPIFKIPKAKQARIRRPSSGTVKKNTLPELQAMHQSLLDERSVLEKELDDKQELAERKRDKSSLMAKNQALKRLQSQKRPNVAAPVPEVPEDSSSKRLRDSDNFVKLPDLNFPAMGGWD